MLAALNDARGENDIGHETMSFVFGLGNKHVPGCPDDAPRVF
jgi:hypothetical protein